MSLYLQLRIMDTFQTENSTLECHRDRNKPAGAISDQLLFGPKSGIFPSLNPTVFQTFGAKLKPSAGRPSRDLQSGS